MSVERAGPLRRTAGLAAGEPLARTTPMARTQMKAKPRRRSTAPFLARLAGRSGGPCEIQIADVCWGLALDPCHRIGSKAGGRQGAAGVAHDRMSNALHGCRGCHSWQTATADNAATARVNGWVLGEGADTEGTPALYRGSVAFLLDSGVVVY